MKVRVIQVVTLLELGGAQQVALYTAGHLDRSCYDVTLVSGGPEQLSLEAREQAGTEFIEIPELVREVSPVNDLSAFIKLYEIIKRYVKATPTGVVVHTHSSKAGILGRFAARLAGAKVVVHTIHGFGFNDRQGWLKRGLFKTAERLASSAGDMVIAVADDNITKGVREGIFPRKSAVTIRCGIDTGYFSEPPADIDAVKSGLGIPPVAPVVTMVSNLKPQKAPLDFVRVAGIVLKSAPDTHFVQAGDGELRDAMLAEADRLGVSGRLHMLGWRSDVRDIIYASDVVVLTSLWEGLPLVAPQAMAAGKPVVATAVDGTPEAVIDGVNGFLAAPHDIGRMAEKVALLLADKQLAARMGEAGRGMVTEFDQDEMVRRVEALYERLLEAKR